LKKNWPKFGVAALAVLLLALLVLSKTRAGRNAGDPDEQRLNKTEAAPELAGTENGEPILHLKPAREARLALGTVVLTSEELKPELTAYGHLEEDPSRSFLLRAQIAGILHYASNRDWPSVGQHLADGAVVGTIEPRFTPSERISLNTQLTTATSELGASTGSVAAARSAYDRAKILNADNKNVSDQAVQDAEVRLQAEQARLDAATRTIRQIETSLAPSGPTGSRTLRTERGGEVVELLAQPGESIEAGSPILRVANLDQLLARVNIPVGEHIPATVSSARIEPVGFENQPIAASRIAVAPAVDPRVQGEAFLFRLNGARFGLRPGVAVTAYLPLPGVRQAGVVIPQAAIVRLQGSAFAYVQRNSGEFIRRQVSLDHPTGEGYFTTESFHAGDRVVSAGAQSLLSEELKSQLGDVD